MISFPNESAKLGLNSGQKSRSYPIGVNERLTYHMPRLRELRIRQVLLHLWRATGRYGLPRLWRADVVPGPVLLQLRHGRASSNEV